MQLEFMLEEERPKRILSELNAGDWFVRDEAKRPMKGRVVYMVLFEHSRLSHFQHAAGGILAVSLKSGRIEGMKTHQKIKPVCEPVKVEVLE